MLDRGLQSEVLSDRTLHEVTVHDRHVVLQSHVAVDQRRRQETHRAGDTAADEEERHQLRLGRHAGLLFAVPRVAVTLEADTPVSYGHPRLPVERRLLQEGAGGVLEGVVLPAANGKVRHELVNVVIAEAEVAEEVVQVRVRPCHVSVGKLGHLCGRVSARRVGMDRVDQRRAVCAVPPRRGCLQR